MNNARSSAEKNISCDSHPWI